jgi:DNA repair exonuclease SbcCD ATPase subunit
MSSTENTKDQGLYLKFDINDPSMKAVKPLFDSLSEPLEKLSELAKPLEEPLEKLSELVKPLEEPLEKLSEMTNEHFAKLSELAEPLADEIRSAQASLENLVQKTPCLPWSSCFPWALKARLPNVQSHIQDPKVSEKVSDPGSLPETVSPK